MASWLQAAGPFRSGSGGQVEWRVLAMASDLVGQKPVFKETDWIRMGEENNICALILSGGIPQSILDEWMLAAKMLHA